MNTRRTHHRPVAVPHERAEDFRLIAWPCLDLGLALADLPSRWRDPHEGLDRSGLCTGAGLCVDHCPDLFVVLEDGIGYVHDGSFVVSDLDGPSIPVPLRYEQAAIDAVERCPGECIYLEPDSPRIDTVEDADIVDDEIVDI